MALIDDIEFALIQLHNKTNKEWISLNEIYSEVEKIRKVPNANNGASIRASLEIHSKGSDVFNGDERFVMKEKGSGLYKLVNKNDIYNQRRVQSSSDWIKVLDNEEALEKDKILSILKYVYLSKNHSATCTSVSKFVNEDIRGIDSTVSSFGKRVLDLLGLPEMPGDNGHNRRLNIPFMTDDNLNKDVWKMRPELVQAIEKKYDLKKLYDIQIDDGAKFVLENFDKTIKLVSNNENYHHLKGKVIAEYHRVKYIKYTGNMYDYFLQFKGGKRKYADDFSFLKDYGILPNELMADYLEEHFNYELDHYSGIDDLIVGKAYSNNEIANTFKCSNMGGMRRSHETNSLVLIAKHNNPLYDDQWSSDGILNYTGMGTTGDQSIEFSQNKTLAIAAKEGIKVYLFESYVDNEYYYDGEVELIGPIFQAEEIDVDGNLRTVIKYPLRRKDNNSNVIIDIESVKQSEKEKIKEVIKHSIEDIKDKAKSFESKDVSTKEVKTIYRERNQYVAEYTKDRAKGICDLCGKEAPFKDKDGKPYLESHHVITLAEGGPDGVYNTVAICPNCHRKIHILKDSKDMKKLEDIILKYLLDDDDRDNIKKWEELFK